LALLAWWQVARVYGVSTVEALRSALPAFATVTMYFVTTTAVGWLLAGPSLGMALLAGVAQVAVFGGLMWATGELRALRAAM
jgi:hypothetical protein